MFALLCVAGSAFAQCCNTATGQAALQNNTVGDDNTADGVGSLFLNTTGSNNTAAGFDSLFHNTSGFNNTAVGILAGTTLDGSNIIGSSNTFLGFDTAIKTGNINNAVAIGVRAEVDQPNSIVLGAIKNVNGANFDSVVGIGTTAPLAPLHINRKPPLGGQDVVLVTSGGGGEVASLLLQNTGPGLRMRHGVGTDAAYVSSSGPLLLFTGDTTGTPSHPGVAAALAIDSSRRVGINTTSPQHTLDVFGDAHITGNLIKGGGSFKIDHPLDPANKYLSHSFVESPDMMDVYNGNVVTDKSGVATVELPDWFEALNRDFRYQLTSIGQFSQAMVVKEVRNHQFTIKTSKPGVKVSWQVTGIRHDAYADAHRIPLEEVKSPEEQGYYLHPELFGAGPEKSVSARSQQPTGVSAASSSEIAIASAQAVKP